MIAVSLTVDVSGIVRYITYIEYLHLLHHIWKVDIFTIDGLIARDILALSHDRKN